MLATLVAIAAVPVRAVELPVDHKAVAMAFVEAMKAVCGRARAALPLGEDDQATTFMKVSAGLSLSFWLLVLLLGRLLPAFEGSTSFL